MSKYDALKELEQMQDPFVFADKIAPVLGVKPETLIYQAKKERPARRDVQLKKEGKRKDAFRGEYTTRGRHNANTN